MAITIEHSTDVALLDSIICHPDVYAVQAQDTDAKPDEFTLAPIIEKPYNIFILIRKDGEPAGFCSFLPHAGTSWCYVRHTNFLPGMRGEVALEGALQALDFIFTRTSCLYVMSYKPTYLTNAINFSHKCGLRDLYTIPRLWVKNGVKCDVLYQGIELLSWFFHDGWHRHLTAGQRFYKSLGLEPTVPQVEGAMGLALDMTLAGGEMKATKFFAHVCKLFGELEVGFQRFEEEKVTVFLEDGDVLEVDKEYNAVEVEYNP